MNYKNFRENIISIEENYFYGGNHCDWVGLDSQFFFNIRYIRKAQSDRHSGLGV